MLVAQRWSFINKIIHKRENWLKIALVVKLQGTILIENYKFLQWQTRSKNYTQYTTLFLVATDYINYIINEITF